LDDLDLRLKRSQIALAEDDRLPQSLLFLHDAFPLVMKQSLSRQRPRACQTGEHNLRRQFRLLVLHVSFALLQSAPGLLQAFGSRQKRLYLQLQFDAFPPQEFAALLLGMAGLPAILVWLVTALVVLVMSLIAMELLLIGHEKLSFLDAGCPVHHGQTSSMKADRISPSWYYYPEYLLSATLRWRSDDEQTRYDPHVNKMMLRRIEPTERCYEERRYKGLSTMDNATKRRDTYKTGRRTIL